MKQKNKIVPLLLCVVMLSVVCVGCKNTDSVISPDSSVNSEVYYLNFNLEQAEHWEKLAQKYSEQMGVDVTVVTATKENYEKTLNSELEKSDAPTLFEVDGPVELYKWQDYCYDLKDANLYKNLKSDDFALKSDDGSVLAVAYTTDTYGVIYNKELLDEYIALPQAVISSVEQINSFDKLKAVTEDIQSKKDQLGIDGAISFATSTQDIDESVEIELVNLPVYYEYRDLGVNSSKNISGTYLENLKKIWDLYINNTTVDVSQLSEKTQKEAAVEFALGHSVFYHGNIKAYDDIKGFEVKDENIGVLPVYIGVEGEENQGLCIGSENYWCINKNASQQQITATIRFLEWVITSDDGRKAVSQDMGYLTPFNTFSNEYMTDNPLYKTVNEYIGQDKDLIACTFAAMPGKEWKEGVKTALINYAQSRGDWSGVETAFVAGWVL